MIHFYKRENEEKINILKPPPKQFNDNTDLEWSPMEEDGEINFEDEEGTLESGEDIKRDHRRETVACTF